jgi:hypothetical protein
MEMPKGNSLCSYLKQAKMYYKIGEEENKTEQVLPGSLGGLVPVGGRRKWGKGVGG